MGNRGRLGLLFDVGTDSEIDALSRDWLLPPAATDKFEEVEEVEEVEEDLHAQIVIQHIEWIVHGLEASLPTPPPSVLILGRGRIKAQREGNE
ncbi:hypothetical protein LTR99_001042 [Exophiala xenobiotica]|uniref:Uncharacterized protein n=1 Tax=Vermiconidia calcicola TaxID=1690605 RepID=A0AAV9QQ12_9PEZI|nr:hypothetical protein LTR92_001474 [Exophiala xenobiotica]KAK5308070.1 hypothetical protein LTR99_001042 [Exophiala xenobiotica]KAK5437568.1 hypothetical protein LTR34_001112 [Exophiala xenobiotica]KAK5545605.1 hypothetical protein LTR25_000612 [Vermiconidia calcicola]